MESKRRALSKLFFSDPTYDIESLVHTPTCREFGLMPFLPEEMEGRKGLLSIPSMPCPLIRMGDLPTTDLSI